MVARAEVGAEAEPLDLGEQRFLHAKLAAELHERRGAVAQHLGHGERREQAVAGLRVGIGGGRGGRGGPPPPPPPRGGGSRGRAGGGRGAGGGGGGGGGRGGGGERGPGGG